MEVAWMEVAVMEVAAMEVVAQVGWEVHVLLLTLGKVLFKGVGGNFS